MLSTDNTEVHGLSLTLALLLALMTGDSDTIAA